VVVVWLLQAEKSRKKETNHSIVQFLFESKQT
jgi:hypothetical protein